MPTIERTWIPEFALDLGSVLGPLAHGRGDPSFRLERAHPSSPLGAAGRGQAPTAWWATSTPDGPGTLRLAQLPAEGAVLASAWGAGAGWLLDAVPILLGATDSPDDFVPAHPVVARALRRNQGWRAMRTRRPFDACIAAVIEQKVTGLEARRAWRTLVSRFGAPAAGPVPAGMAVPPTPKAWSAISDAEFHRAGVTPQRVRTLRVVASAASAIERTTDLGGIDADRLLRALPGIGQWTSAEVRQRAHGDPDAVSFGDYHVAQDLCWWLTGESGDDDRMAYLLEPYVGHRYRVQRLMELSGAHAPRRGPRMSIPEHRTS